MQQLGESDPIPADWTRYDSVCQNPRLEGQGNESVVYWTPVHLRPDISDIKKVVQTEAHVYMLRAIHGRIPHSWQMVQVFLC